jgi:carbonic anhydrase
LVESNRPTNPKEAWAAIVEGNARFVSGNLAHPRQDIDHREKLAQAQKPFAALFGCADSRLSAEIIFDVGLGDLFVVRNAGQVIAETILGSLEYAVEVLGVPLILVLGHDECGAIRATIDATEGKMNAQGEFIHNLVERISPTVKEAQQNNELSSEWNSRQITELFHSTFYGSLTRAKSSRDNQQSINTMKLLFNNLKTNK